MRKILLGTTAVVGAALIGATTAQAQQAPTVRVGGYFEFNVGYVDDTLDSSTAPGAANLFLAPGIVAPAQQARRDRWDFRQGDTEIHLFVTAKAANGMSYGATIELQFDNAVTQGAGTVVDTDEAWGFVSSPTLGTLRFGDEDSAASLMQVGIPAVTGNGVSDYWDEFVAAAPDGTRYLISGINDGSDATKIIYMSPQFFGFDFGVSFAPNAREGEAFQSVAGGLQRDPGDGLSIAGGNVTLAAPRNEMSGAIRYRGSFGNIGVQAGFAAMRGDAPQINTANNVRLQDVTAYQVGLQVSGFGFTVGGAYNWGKFGSGSVGRSALAEGLGNSSNWAVGATYVMGAWSFGAYYGVGERDSGTTRFADREQSVFGIGVVYNLAPGMDLVANYTNVRDRNIPNFQFGQVNPAGAATTINRDIDLVIVGTRIAF